MDEENGQGGTGSGSLADLLYSVVQGAGSVWVAREQRASDEVRAREMTASQVTQANIAATAANQRWQYFLWLLLALMVLVYAMRQKSRG